MDQRRTVPVAGIVNFGAGNLGNVKRALFKLDVESVLLETPDDMKRLSPTLLLLPGVGAFRPAMGSLRSSGWSDALKDWAKEGRPLLGICLGMQLLCAQSAEGGQTEGIGLLDGHTRKLTGVKKIPHMGWNSTNPSEDDDFPANCLSRPGQNFYFVHSFAVSDSRDCVARTEVDGVSFCSILRRENVAGFQFHPERSGPEGVDFLGRAIAFFDKIYS